MKTDTSYNDEMLVEKSPEEIVTLQSQILAHCSTMVGAVESFNPDWNANRYLVGDKMFLLMGTDGKGRPVATVKLAPEKGEFLRKQFPKQIIPGYYMNKIHWNSVYLDLPVDKDLLWECLDESHSLIFSGLSKKKQAELSES